MFWTPVIDGVDLFALDWKEVVLSQNELLLTGGSCACCIRYVEHVRVCIWQVDPVHFVSDRCVSVSDK
jgi:hypothetical protein